MASFAEELSRMLNIGDKLRGVQWFDLMVDAEGLQVDVDIAVTITNAKAKIRKKKKGAEGDEDGEDSSTASSTLAKKLRIIRFHLNDEDRRDTLNFHAAKLKVIKWDGIEDHFHDQVETALRAWAHKQRVRRAMPSLEHNKSPKTPKSPKYW